MVKWQSFHSLVMPELPGCPILTVDSALALSAADFCARTQMWREMADAIKTRSGEPRYDLSGSAIIEAVVWAAIGATQLAPTLEMHVSVTDRTRRGTPTQYWVENDTVLYLYPVPDGAYTVSVEVALKPSRTALGVEDWIFETWADAIVSGAIAQLARVPNKEWSNPDLAVYHTMQFDYSVSTARVRGSRNTPQRIATPAWR